MHSKNLSIMITDIRGYSDKSAGSSREDLLTFLETHRKLLKPVIEFYEGTVVKSLGDSFLCTFESATDATVCAIAIQLIVDEFNRKITDAGNSLTIRVVINSGDVTIKGNDIFGDAVNLAARMEKIPEIGQGGIAISQSTYLLMNRQEIIAEPLGSYEFKGIPQPVQVYRIPLNLQKLSQLPTRLSELVQRVVSGEEITTTIQFTSTMRTRTFTKLKWGLIAASFVLVVSGASWLLFSEERSSNSREAFQVLEWLRRSDKNRTQVISKADFVGPSNVFTDFDSNVDGFITPDEVVSWADKKGIELPPPPSPGQ